MMILTCAASMFFRKADPSGLKTVIRPSKELCKLQRNATGLRQLPNLQKRDEEIYARGVESGIGSYELIDGSLAAKERAGEKTIQGIQPREKH